MSQYYNMSIRNLEYRLRKFKNDLPRHLEDVIYDQEPAIINAVAVDQLYRRGINGKGVKIMSYRPYTPFTVAYKRLRGQPATRVTLRDSGLFYNSLYVEFDAGGVRVMSDDPVAEKLVDKYGPEILRLTNKNFNRVIRSHVRKELIRRIKQDLKIGRV